MLLVTIALITVVGLSFRAGRIVGVVSLILGAVVYAVAIALFLICMAVSGV